ncbi:cytochrome c oxidase accessory protein CcoG [Denitratisoma oestradiolicum]|uniref:Cytochrome c oxidase accessory protein FixG n=1 Tax=Denitratisoma oestradiolicum TaxID=311182 RepID=A0A6S6XXR6_9PROT|nr:cytochrome c oxidase accessory protein CcoG [Denitratisoma oestradiolicum]TWO79904.1 cytochrome c oxidase accessory protein CcoG [Denitratisoma oestradiolicum]CAB1369659.1 Cytochrome c oxidase accessory protein FixG [Denitratisoma oestradiolicum]
MSAESPGYPPNISESAEEPLYEIQKKIYARSVSGRFATWRWVLVWLTQLVYYGFCWLPWNGRQAVLFDLVERKFYIFGLILWPQDVFFLAVLLIICAYAMFLFTAVGGRLWCGYACPQTVYTELFMWIEQVFEGDRNARMRLDQAPMNAEKFIRKTGKYSSWILLSAWTGFTLVGYFTPVKTLWGSFWSFNLGPWESFWIFFYGGFTYLLAGHLREQVCKYMCPYARFQGVMFDPDTLVITYDEERGEPRGPRSKKIDYRQQGLGDCVDCGLCVAVCPTGIDIRQGLQYECIGCAACIDACDQVMDKMGYPMGLIRYSTEHAVEQHWGWKDILGHIIRPRVVIYSAVLAAICIAFAWGLATKPSLRVDVIRDRATLSREVEDGLIENVYRLQVMNVSEQPQTFHIEVEGLPGIHLEGIRTVAVGPASVVPVTIQIRAPLDSGKRGANRIHINVASPTDDKARVHEKATFFLP